MTNPTRVLLVDDHILFRKGLASLVASDPNLEVAGEAADGFEAIDLAGKQAPDVVLLDIKMPRCTGLEAIPGLKRAAPAAGIIMLTASEEDDDLFAAVRAGADGYLLKDLEPEQLFEMLDAARRGEIAMTGSLAAKILLEFRRQRPAPAPGIYEELTPRETEVLRAVARGATNKEVAAELNISDNTVKNHLRNILEKLHLQNRTQATAYAIRQGLVSSND